MRFVDRPDDGGQCRRFPPRDRFPEVRESDWCGEHTGLAWTGMGITYEIDLSQGARKITETVKSLRLALGDTQQQFAQRTGLAISTVVRYESTRPPRGVRLAQMERLARTEGKNEIALALHEALNRELNRPTSGYEAEAWAQGI